MTLEDELHAQIDADVDGSNIQDITRLIDEGADINYQNDDGETSLHLACGRGQREVVQLLLDRSLQPFPFFISNIFRRRSAYSEQ